MHDPNETRIGTEREERISWVLSEMSTVGYSPSDGETPGRVVFPYSPEKCIGTFADEDEQYQKKIRDSPDELSDLLKARPVFDGKFVLLSMRVGKPTAPKKSIVQLSLDGESHLTIARYAAQEFMQYVQQGIGNVAFTPADVLFLQSHHDTGHTRLVNKQLGTGFGSDNDSVELSAIDGGRIKLLHNRELVVYGASQTFSTPGVVTPDAVMLKYGAESGRETIKKQKAEHISRLELTAGILRDVYADSDIMDKPFTVRVET